MPPISCVKTFGLSFAETNHMFHKFGFKDYSLVLMAAFILQTNFFYLCEKLKTGHSLRHIKYNKHLPDSAGLGM